MCVNDAIDIVLRKMCWQDATVNTDFKKVCAEGPGDNIYFSKWDANDYNR